MRLRSKNPTTSDSKDSTEKTPYLWDGRLHALLLDAVVDFRRLRQLFIAHGTTWGVFAIVSAIKTYHWNFSVILCSNVLFFKTSHLWWCSHCGPALPQKEQKIKKKVGPYIKQKHTFRLQEIELWLHPAGVATVVSCSRSTRHGCLESAPWSPSHWICQLRIWCCGQRESHVWHLHTRFATQKDGNKNRLQMLRFACGFLNQIHDLCMVSLQNIFLELHKKTKINNRNLHLCNLFKMQVSHPKQLHQLHIYQTSSPLGRNLHKPWRWSTYETQSLEHPNERAPRERNFHENPGALLIFNYYQQNLSWESWSMTKSSTSRTQNIMLLQAGVAHHYLFSEGLERVRKKQETTNWKQLISSWWFQLIWKSYPQIGLKPPPSFKSRANWTQVKIAPLCLFIAPLCAIDLIIAPTQVPMCVQFSIAHLNGFCCIGFFSANRLTNWLV